MAQIFDRSSNALARMSLVLTGLIVIALGVTLDSLQRSPWVTRQGQRPDQPVPFSHKHHVQGLGLQCQYCHTSVEKSSYAGIPPTKTCMNCHAQIWTNAALLEPVRQSWATNESVVWTKVHDLPDYVYFNHSIHVNKGLGCASCHGRVDLMPLMYQQNTLQMEWCLNCHRDPAKNLRPVSQIYNMAWEGPTSQKPVWCAVGGEQTGKPTAQSVDCRTEDPGKGGVQVASLTFSGLMAGMQDANQPGSLEGVHSGPRATETVPPMLPAQLNYTKFTSQRELGYYLMDHYKIRSANQLSSCEVCHR
jgi:hypothetical protein